MTTAGMFNTMLRLGMKFDDAALFLSQDIIGRLLNQFNRENLSGYKPLDFIINEWIAKYRKRESINDSSDINTEALTKEELIEGLTSNKHENIDYKVLMTFQKLRSMTDAMRKPTFVTRLNSISSAVGPLIVDNLIMEHKMDAFTMSKMPGESPFCTIDGTPIDAKSILNNHPILKQFSRAIGIAGRLFVDMPAGSVGFRNLLDNLSESIANKIYGDKKLFDQLSNFYQSYLLIQSGMVKSEDLNYYVNKFPKEFIDKKFREKYPDNELIQAIKFNVSKTGRSYLTIKITGMEEQAKEELRSAWIDLHRVDPKLSQDLFNYSFFIAGIGFSPKTFMALVPTLVKEKLKSNDGKVSYVDTYRNFPEVVPDIVIDQFIRNNWNNNKLVPMKGGKNTHYNVDLKKGALRVYRTEEKADLADVKYMKTKQNGGTYLWQFVKEENNDLVYKRVSPLGNNGEYIEMSTSDIKKSLKETLETKENNEPSSLSETSTSEALDLEDTGNQQLTATEAAKKLSEITELIMKQVPKYSIEEAEAVVKRIKGHERQYAKFLQNVFRHKGLELSIEEAINEFRKYC